MTEDIESRYTDEVVCPYCGYVHGDSWEMGGNAEDWEQDCLECGVTFLCSRNVSVSYSSRKVKP